MHSESSMWMKLSGTVLFLVLLGSLDCDAANNWKPADGPLMTRWTKDVSPKNAHPEYPRPQMVRKDWQNLNGLWDYAVTARDAVQPAKWDGQILVPFPVESALSGVMKRLYETNQLWYHRTFKIPRGWKGRNVLLNFGAVDWKTTVWVNGKKAGEHLGGYDEFTFDITDALKAKGENEIVVSVWDPTDAGPQPRGKQVRKPGGIWYTPTTGIWQTVWMEPVASTYIQSIGIIPDVDQSRARFRIQPAGVFKTGEIELTILDGSKSVVRTQAMFGKEIVVQIPKTKLWSPESPLLYEVRLKLVGGRLVRAYYADKTGRWDQEEIEPGKESPDIVRSYFAMRKISMARDDKGRLRIQLNNKPYFMLGPLDQGFWPDGIYTAPTDEALRNDIEVLKKLGFNMARKHVKVEPDRWYYWCDKLGLLVWQDMPSGDRSAEWHGPSGVDGKEMTRTAESAAIYEGELRALIAGRYNHPCIVTWVPFNEGWGQFDTVRILNLAKQIDPTRLVDGASGGNNFTTGDIIDHHQYPGPGAPPAVTDRAMVLGEFGGLGLPVRGHTWQSEKNWGYRSFKTPQELTDAYVGLIEKLKPMIEDKGLSAAIYTQTTDVEVEVNGLMTYDRALVKMTEGAVAEANKKVYVPMGKDETPK